MIPALSATRISTARKVPFGAVVSVVRISTFIVSSDGDKLVIELAHISLARIGMLTFPFVE